MTVETIEVLGRNVTVDLLLWRRFRRRTPGLGERVLALNPGLADAVFIPAGTAVKVPLDVAAAAPARSDIVELWA